MTNHSRKPTHPQVEQPAYVDRGDGRGVAEAREIVTAVVQCWSLSPYPLEVRRVLLGDRTTTLIASCRRHLYGDEFSVYHARVYPLVQRVVGKYLRGWPGEVDEVVNTVMAKLWRRWPLPSLENAYAAAAARNACLDHLECMQGLYAECVSVEENGVPELGGPPSLRPIVMTAVQGCAHRDEERLIAAALSGLGCDQDVAPLEQSLAELVRHKVRELIAHVDERSGTRSQFRETVIKTFVAAMEHHGEAQATQQDLADLLGRSSPMVARYLKILLAGLGVVCDKSALDHDPDPDPMDPTPQPGGGAPLAGAPGGAVAAVKRRGGADKKLRGKKATSALEMLDRASEMLSGWVAGDIAVFEEILAAEEARQEADFWCALFAAAPCGDQTIEWERVSPARMVFHEVDGLDQPTNEHQIRGGDTEESLRYQVIASDMMPEPGLSPDEKLIICRRIDDCVASFDRELAGTLARVHAAGVIHAAGAIHHDITPSNPFSLGRERAIKSGCEPPHGARRGDSAMAVLYERHRRAIKYLNCLWSEDDLVDLMRFFRDKLCALGMPDDLIGLVSFEPSPEYPLFHGDGNRRLGSPICWRVIDVWRSAVISPERMPVIEKPWLGHSGGQRIDLLQSLVEAAKHAYRARCKPWFVELVKTTAWKTSTRIGRLQVIHYDFSPENVVGRLLERGLIVCSKPKDSVPLAGAPLTKDQLTSLAHWIEAWFLAEDANADIILAEPPSRPGNTFATPGEVLAAIRDDINDLDEAQALRYLTIAHLHNAGYCETWIDGYRHALAKLLNHLSQNPEIWMPQTIDEARTTFRIDLDDDGWTEETWAATTNTPRVAFDYPSIAVREIHELLSDDLLILRRWIDECVGVRNEVDRASAFVGADNGSRSGGNFNECPILDVSITGGGNGSREQSDCRVEPDRNCHPPRLWDDGMYGKHRKPELAIKSDCELLQGWRRGDRAMAMALYDRHRTAITKLVRRSVRSEDDVVHLVQQTFDACVRGTRGLDDIRSFRSYIHGVARYVMMHFFRKRRNIDDASNFASPWGNEIVVHLQWHGHASDARSWLEECRQAVVVVRGVAEGGDVPRTDASDRGTMAGTQWGGSVSITCRLSSRRRRMHVARGANHGSSSS